MNKKIKLLSVLTMFAVCLNTFGIPAAIAVEPVQDNAAINDNGELEKVYADSRWVQHKPQEYLIPEIEEIEEIESGLTDLPDMVKSQLSKVFRFGFNEPILSYSVGNSRTFYLENASNFTTGYKPFKGNMIAQSEHSNVWILDHTDYHSQSGIRPCGSNCTLTKITANMGIDIANEFDKSYRAMTDPVSGFAPHAGIEIATGVSNQPLVGDIGKDGKVNILLYDIGDDGQGQRTAYTAGFFTNGDFFTAYGGNDMNALDMFHMDIGMGQGYSAFSQDGEQDDKLSFYGTLAHEFQHMLFYMHYNVYNPSGAEDNVWINEGLSEIAHAFYTEPGVEIVDDARMQNAVENEYPGTSHFMGFQSNMKNYGITRMFAHWLYNSYERYNSRFYQSVIEKLPSAQTVNEKKANTDIISELGVRTIFGDAFKAATGLGNGGNDSIREVYFKFMEAFASDGNYVNEMSEFDEIIKERTVKIIQKTPQTPFSNIWAIRSVMGIYNASLFSTYEETLSGYGLSYDLSAFSGFVPIPELNSGSFVTIPPNVTKERFYKLSAAVSDKPVLNITVPDTDSDTVRFYAAVQSDDVITDDSVRSTGENGAAVYKLKAGENRIDTDGKPVYLMVAVFDGGVDAQIMYNWEKPVGGCEESSICDKCGGCLYCSKNPGRCTCEEDIPCIPCDCYVLGDVDNDGVIKLNDALQILMYLANMEESVLYSDVRAVRASLIISETDIAVSDAVEILWYLAGFSDILNGKR